MNQPEHPIESPVAANDNGEPGNEPNVCATNKPAEINVRYLAACRALEAVDLLLMKLVCGTHEYTRNALKAAVYFAIYCHEHPQEAEALEGWAEAKPKAGNNPFYSGIRYAARNMRSRALDSKFTMWAAIAQWVHKHNIPESHFLHAVKTNGGIDRWYRNIPKASGNGGKPTGNTGKSASTAVCAPAQPEPANDVNPYLSETVLQLANDGRQLVAVVLDITQSATLDYQAIEARFRVLDEYVDVVAIANLGEAA